MTTTGIYCIMTARLAHLLRAQAIGAGGLGFDSQAGQMEHSVVNSLLPLRCFFGAVLSRR